MDFNDIHVSTTTNIISTNLHIDLNWLFNIINVTDICTDTIKTKNIKKKDFQSHVIKLNPPYGTITLVQHNDKIKGIKITPKKKRAKVFRNGLSIVMYVGKLVNIKIPKKGKIQMTGCLHISQAELCIKYIWNLLTNFDQSPERYMLLDCDTIKIFIRTVMTDIVFQLGFKVNRQNLDKYINCQTEYTSLLNTSFGPGVNIKMPFNIDKDNVNILCMEYKDGKWVKSYISFDEYLNIFKDDYKKETEKIRRNTFLVFHSGSTLMSGMSPEYMKDGYKTFINIIKDAKNTIEEKLD